MSYETLPTVVANEPIQADWGNQVKDNFESGPRGVLGVATQNSGQGSITTLVDLTGLSVTVDVAAGRLIRITGFVRAAISTADNPTRVGIYEGATRRTASDMSHPATSVAGIQTHRPAVLMFSPSEGSHTYKLAAEAPSSGTMSTNHSSTLPAFILVEDLGPDPTA